MSYYKSVKETRTKEISKYNSSSTRCNLLISFYSFFNSNMYDMFTRESESMHTPFSEDFVDLDILICLDVLDLHILLHFGNFLT